MIFWPFTLIGWAIDEWRQGWKHSVAEAKTMRPEPFSPDKDYLHGLRQLAAYGTPYYRERAHKTLEQLGETY